VIDSAVILAVSAPAHTTQLPDRRPRAMLPALGKPMVVRVMDRLYRAGIRRYVVILGINEGAVASYLNRQWMPDAKVEFKLQANESLTLLLSQIAREFDKPFLIASYNSFTYERYISSLIKRHDEYPDHLILTGGQLSLSPDALDNHYVVMKGQDIQSIETQKPDNAHLILSEDAICGHIFLDYLKTMDSKTAMTYGKYWFNIAKKYTNTQDAKVTLAETSWILRVESDKDLLTLNRRLFDDSNDAHILSELPYTVKVIPPVRIDPQVSVGQGVVIGPYVYVERGSSIAYGATIKNAIILGRSSVSAEAEIDGAIVHSKGMIKF
jgi:NDP-sugar pyrophosphorylase family protein